MRRYGNRGPQAVGRQASARRSSSIVRSSGVLIASVRGAHLLVSRRLRGARSLDRLLDVGHVHGSLGSVAPPPRRGCAGNTRGRRQAGGSKAGGEFASRFSYPLWCSSPCRRWPSLRRFLVVAATIVAAAAATAAAAHPLPIAAAAATAAAAAAFFLAAVAASATFSSSWSPTPPVKTMWSTNSRRVGRHHWRNGNHVHAPPIDHIFQVIEAFSFTLITSCCLCSVFQILVAWSAIMRRSDPSGSRMRASSVELFDT